MRNEIFEKALRLKGYGSYEEPYTPQLKRKIESPKTVGDLRVQPTVVTSLREYVDFILTLETSYENPVFYRGQGNANFTINPNSLRVDPKRLFSIFLAKGE